LAQFIPESIVAEVRQAANIVSVIGEYVQLKKAGINHIGLCPFHAEKTPSFSVNEQKQMFKCFGCGVGGNVYTFLMRQSNLSFPEAVKLLASRYGIQIPTDHLTAEQKRQLNERDQIFEINQTALTYYQKQLKSSEGERARKYFENRCLSMDIQKKFQLGYAPDGWRYVVGLFSKRGLPLKLVEKAGLIIQKNNKGYYDRFRDRVIFPIINVNNQVAGFGGRVLNDGTPKYLNSPETQVYHKSRMLYGLRESRNQCRKQNHVFIVEGYMDLLAMVQHGIQNVVATLGTALTSHHIRLLKGFAKNMTLVFDSDHAGIQAAKRSIALFLKEEIDAQVMVLPENHDPDTFLNKCGVDQFIERSNNAYGMMAFLIEASMKTNGNSIKGKIAVINELKPLLSQINDAVIRSLYIKEISEQLNIEESAIFSEVRKLMPRTATPEKQHSDNRKINETGHRLEKQIIAMMLHCSDIHDHVQTHGILDAFEDQELQSIGNLILQQQSPFDPNQLIHQVDSQKQQALIVSLSMIEQQWSKEQCIALIRQFVRRMNANKRQRLLAEIENAEKKQDYKLVEFLQNQLCHLI